MTRFHVVLVEDDPLAATENLRALEDAGFAVSTFNDAITALEYARESADLVDLMVLDRRLPYRSGETATDSVGDELLPLMLESRPDVVAIIFSGHTGFEHLQFATTDRGVVSMADGKVTLDRVRLFEKGQSLEFDQYVARVHDALSRLEDIEISASDSASLSGADRRLLRRLAFEFGGSSVEARSLTGGLTSAPVWLCRIYSKEVPLARIVAKRQKHPVQPGGFQHLCPGELTAGTVSVVRGFCGGFVVSVQQLVGDSPESLMSHLVDRPQLASKVVITLRDGLDAIESGHTGRLAISDIAAPFLDWQEVEVRGRDVGIEVPPGSRIASSVQSAQHGDLHPGNVLVQGMQPVVIDFDSQTFGSELLDPIAMLLGPIFHPDSPLRGQSWPTLHQCRDLLSADFLDGCPSAEYFGVVQAWLTSRKCSNREFFALILAFSLRQTKFPDVEGDETTLARAVEFASWASEALSST